MIKTILVPTGGRDSDDSVFSTALAVAQPLAAHLHFYHVRCSAGEPAARPGHLDFCADREVSRALSEVTRTGGLLSKRSVEHFTEFCAVNQVAMRSLPGSLDEVSAAFSEDSDHLEARLLFQARHSDLVVLGRPTRGKSRADGLIEKLLLGSGRPIIIAPVRASTSTTDTVVVGWKETPEAARAVSAMMPLLRTASRVMLIHVLDDENSSADGINQVAVQLAWHGIEAEARLLRGNTTPASQLSRVALENNAKLVVIGGYGHGPWHEAAFGGVTRELIEHAELPICMVH